MTTLSIGEMYLFVTALTGRPAFGAQHQVAAPPSGGAAQRAQPVASPASADLAGFLRLVFHRLAQSFADGPIDPIVRYYGRNAKRRYGPQPAQAQGKGVPS